MYKVQPSYAYGFFLFLFFFFERVESLCWFCSLGWKLYKFFCPDTLNLVPCMNLRKYPFHKSQNKSTSYNRVCNLLQDYNSLCIKHNPLCTCLVFPEANESPERFYDRISMVQPFYESGSILDDLYKKDCITTLIDSIDSYFVKGTSLWCTYWERKKRIDFNFIPVHEYVTVMTQRLGAKSTSFKKMRLFVPGVR